MLFNFNQNEEDFEKYFNYHSKYFQGIFLLYDVDHNSNVDIGNLMNKFNDEFTGMLLLSSPRIEVIGDFNRNRKENRWTHLKEYKKELNNYYKHGAIDEIIKNFDKFIIHFIKKNKEELKSNNVMEHPSLLVKKINEMNIRYNDNNKENSYVIYRYFSTVIYVLVAHCHKLTKQINNVDNVIEFFENKSKS